MSRRTTKRVDVAEKNKLFKKKKKRKKIIKAKEMWKRLGELNKEFSEIKKAQKDSKKMSESIIIFFFFNHKFVNNILSVD